jgi:hypothetical protein
VWAGRGFNHVGDIDVIGQYIYAPLEQQNYAEGTQAAAIFDRDTLRFVDAVRAAPARELVPSPSTRPL